MADTRRVRQVFVGLGAFTGAFVLGLVLTFVAERLAGKDHVLRSVTLAGRSVSGLTSDQVIRRLQTRAERLKGEVFTLRLADHGLEVSGEQLGLTVEADQGARRALEAGKTGNWGAQFAFWIARLFSEHHLVEPIVVDRTKAKEQIAPWAEKILPAARLPFISYRDGLVVEPGRPGSVIDYQALEDVLVSRVRRGEDEPVALEATHRPLRVSPDEVEKQKERAEALVREPIGVRTTSGQTTTLSPADLGTALESFVVEEKGELHLKLNEEKLRTSLKDLLSEHERAPVEANFEFDARGQVTVTPSQAGVALDFDALSNAIWQASTSTDRIVELPLEADPPNLSTEEAETLGIKGLAGSFVTHHPCCQPRVDNIHKAAGVIDGHILRPGEKFSLNDVLGPRTKSAGYRTAPTIVRGEMEEMYGGGISQLATTLFNAVLRSGYKIIQRQPHSVYFPRYPEGHEATVSYPQPDLIFENDTQSGMVIKTQVAGTFVKVLIFGDDEGRVTTVNKSRRYDVKKPPTEYEADDSMKPEESKRVRAGQLGWTVLVSRTVKYPDGQKKVESREVVYNPRPELVRVHSCKIPEGEEGHTGDECPEPEREEREEELSEDTYYETTFDHGEMGD